MRQDQVPQSSRQTEQAVERLGEILVLGRAGDRLVKFVIQVKEAMGVCGRGIGLFLAQGLKDDQVVRRGALGGQAGTECLQWEAHLADLLQVGYIDVGHVQPVAGCDDDQVLVSEQSECLAYRHLPHVQLLRQLLFVDRRARGHLQRGDLFPYQFVGALGVDPHQFHSHFLYLRSLSIQSGVDFPWPWPAHGRCPARRSVAL